MAERGHLTKGWEFSWSFCRGRNGLVPSERRAKKCLDWWGNSNCRGQRHQTEGVLLSPAHIHTQAHTGTHTFFMTAICSTPFWTSCWNAHSPSPSPSPAPHPWVWRPLCFLQRSHCSVRPGTLLGKPSITSLLFQLFGAETGLVLGGGWIPRTLICHRY